MAAANETTPTDFDHQAPASNEPGARKDAITTEIMEIVGAGRGLAARR